MRRASYSLSAPCSPPPCAKIMPMATQEGRFRWVFDGQRLVVARMWGDEDVSTTHADLAEELGRPGVGAYDLPRGWFTLYEAALEYEVAFEDGADDAVERAIGQWLAERGLAPRAVRWARTIAGRLRTGSTEHPVTDRYTLSGEMSAQSGACDSATPAPELRVPIRATSLPDSRRRSGTLLSAALRERRKAVGLPGRVFASLLLNSATHGAIKRRWRKPIPPEGRAHWSRGLPGCLCS